MQDDDKIKFLFGCCCRLELLISNCRKLVSTCRVEFHDGIINVIDVSYICINKNLEIQKMSKYDPMSTVLISICIKKKTIYSRKVLAIVVIQLQCPITEIEMIGEWNN